MISVNNGISFCSPEEAIETLPWETIVNAMDDEIREAVHAELSPCTEEQFLKRYLELSTSDLVIG